MNTDQFLSRFTDLARRYFWVVIGSVLLVVGLEILAASVSEYYRGSREFSSLVGMGLASIALLVGGVFAFKGLRQVRLEKRLLREGVVAEGTSPPSPKVISASTAWLSGLLPIDIKTIDGKPMRGKADTSLRKRRPPGEWGIRARSAMIGGGHKTACGSEQLRKLFTAKSKGTAPTAWSCQRRRITE